MKNKNSIALLMVSILLGIVIGLQVRTVSKNNSIKTKDGELRSRELATELKKSIEERDRQRKEIEDLNNLILAYENKYKENDDKTSILYDEIEKYKKLACMTNVSGKGIIITINNPKGIEDSGSSIDNNPEIILRLISVLNSAGAEAISINGQRITAYTEVELAQRVLEINGVSVSSPIIIKAIGDKDTIIPAINIKTGVMDSLRNYGFEAIVKEDDNVSIEKINMLKDFKFAKTVSNEDK